MQVSRIVTVAAFATLAAMTAQAETGKSTEQVRTELQAAQAAGEVPYGFSGMSQREVFPDQFSHAAPTQAKAVYSANDQGLTRDQVRAELIAAEKSGEIVTSFVARPARELLPAGYGQDAGGNFAKTNAVPTTRAVQ